MPVSPRELPATDTGSQGSHRPTPGLVSWGQHSRHTPLHGCAGSSTPVLVGALCLSCSQASVSPGAEALPGGACPLLGPLPGFSAAPVVAAQGLRQTLKLKLGQCGSSEAAPGPWALAPNNLRACARDLAAGCPHCRNGIPHPPCPLQTALTSHT